MGLFSWSIFSEGILPFLIVFVLVFAILQKSKLLGDGKSQIDALIALAVALILIITPVARNFIVEIIPFLAIALVIMLFFLLMYAFIAGKDWYSPWMKWVFGILGGLLIIAVAVWKSGIVETLGSGGNVSSVLINVLLIAIIVGVFALAAFYKEKKE
jgi:hypothetical protein